LINKVLAERGARYGKFADHARIAQGLQEVLHKMPNWPTMDFDMRQALVVITDKIARMGNGDPFYADNWVDIIGYATLVLDRINMLDNEPAELYAPEDARKYGLPEGSVLLESPGFVDIQPGQGAPSFLSVINANN